MAIYPDSDRTRIVRSEALRIVVERIFAALGTSAADAGLLAESLVRADLRGIHSHGVLRVAEYAAKLTTGGVNPRGVPSIVTDAGSLAIADGGNSMGQVGASFAMAEAIARARVHGIGLVALRGSNHCGAMDFWAMMALNHDMIGLAATNALPTMAPWGGVDKIVGINPLAVALPAGTETPVVLDIAFGATAHGKIRVHAQLGAPIPADWAFDAEGRPTTDAVAALDGLIRPIGGHKGVGLAVVSGLLATALSGAAYGTALGNMRRGAQAGADGQVFIAIDLGRLVPPAVFKARVDAAVHQIRTSAPTAGAAAVYAPGMIEAALEARYRADGVPLAEATLSDIAATAGRLGVDAGPIAAV